MIICPSILIQTEFWSRCNDAVCCDISTDVIDEAIVVARDEEQGKAIISKIGAVDIVYDSISGYGPVAGMLAGLKKARYEHVIALACDMPFINPNVVSHLFSLVSKVA